MRGDAQYPHQLPGPAADGVGARSFGGATPKRLRGFGQCRLPIVPDIQPGLQRVLWSRTWRGEARQPKEHSRICRLRASNSPRDQIISSGRPPASKPDWDMRIGTEKWDEQVLRIGETVTHEKASAPPHRRVPGRRSRVEMTIGIDRPSRGSNLIQGGHRRHRSQGQTGVCCQGEVEESSQNREQSQESRLSSVARGGAAHRQPLLLFLQNVRAADGRRRSEAVTELAFENP